MKIYHIEKVTFKPSSALWPTRSCSWRIQRLISPDSFSCWILLLNLHIMYTAQHARNKVGNRRWENNISEGHGGARLACGPASAHYIAEQVLGYGFLRWFENKLYHATLTTYPKVCQLLLLSLGLFVKRSLNSGVEICKMYNAMRVISHTQLNTTECPFCFYFCSKHRRP